VRACVRACVRCVIVLCCVREWGARPCVRLRGCAVKHNLETRNLGALLARARRLLRGPGAGSVGVANVLVIVRVLVQAIYDAVPVDALYEHFAEGAAAAASRACVRVCAFCA
jgi:hypothetical protein